MVRGVFVCAKSEVPLIAGAHGVQTLPGKTPVKCTVQISSNIACVSYLPLCKLFHAFFSKSTSFPEAEFFN
jgi:hypothetical protein